MQEICYALEEIDIVVEQIVLQMDRSSVFTFVGPLGAGKTTLVKKFLARCGVQELVTSPTFTYVCHYKTPSGKDFYHFDLYRLTSLDDFIQAGFAELLYQPNSWACIEWPEIIVPILTSRVTHCALEYEGYERRISFTQIP